MAVFCGSVMPTTKIRRLSDGRLVGAAGSEAVAVQMYDWLEGRGPRPEAQLDEKDSVHLLEIEPGGRVWLHTRAGRVEVEERHCAVGSGSDYARAAMYLGKSAEDAVAVACLFDVHSGLGISTLTLEPPA
jgi:ATP-dependent protease HslVU (ClpYQ) peptidase subunit